MGREVNCDEFLVLQRFLRVDGAILRLNFSAKKFSFPRHYLATFSTILWEQVDE